MDPADIVLHLIARITDAIEFPVGDAEFDAVLDDCIAALEGAPSPAEDRARAERSLRALLGQTDRLGIPVPEDLRAESLGVFAAGGHGHRPRRRGAPTKMKKIKEQG